MTRCTMSAVAVLFAAGIAVQSAAAQNAAQNAAPAQIQIKQIQVQGGAPARIQIQVQGRAIQIAPAQPANGPAIAPIARPAIGYVGYARNPLMLLMNPNVQKELKLDSDIKQEVQEAYQEVNRVRSQDYQKARTLTGKERTKFYQELRTKFETDSAKKAREILEPKQYARLQEILVQVQGISAFHNPQIQKKLKITDAQKQKFAEVQKAQAVKQQKAIRDLQQKVGANGVRFDYKKYREIQKKFQAELEKEMTGVLTKEQQAQFAKMKGKKFEMNTPGRGGIILPRPIPRPLPPVRPGGPNVRPIQIQIDPVPVQPVRPAKPVRPADTKPDAPKK